MKSGFDLYLEYNKVLRTWMVAFGIGGPALFLVNDQVAAKLASVGHLKLVVGLFLFGVASQVLGAFMNKTANWYSYFLGHHPELSKTRVARWANWHGQNFWIDVVIDFVTMVSFGVAAWMVFTVFGNGMA